MMLMLRMINCHLIVAPDGAFSNREEANAIREDRREGSSSERDRLMHSDYQSTIRPH